MEKLGDMCRVLELVLGSAGSERQTQDLNSHTVWVGASDFNYCVITRAP